MEVMELLYELSSGKASGMDGLTGESLKYANPILPVLLSICFTYMFKHCYFPISMLNSVIVPLVKNRNGDLSDKNNYRPIALSALIEFIEFFKMRSTLVYVAFLDANKAFDKINHWILLKS